MRRKGLTSIELAKLAGVSSATVSRAFAPGSRIKAQTRERILALADEHGFRPNAMARSLHSNQSRLVALVVNTIANPAEGEGLTQLIHQLQAMERLPLLLCCADHEDRAQLMRVVSTYQVDHVVLYSDAVSIDDVTNIFRSAVPIIASCEPLNGRAVSEVRIDAAAASREVTTYLVEQGRRHFAYLSGRRASHIDIQRKGWFTEALKGYGLVIDSAGQGDYSYESGYREAILFLRHMRPDVIVCANDLMAVGVRDAAVRLGIKVPEELAIVGHDGVELSRWDCNSITTIMPPSGAVSDALIEVIAQSPTAPPLQRTIICEVRWGHSTGEIPR
ncbi:MAG TPA: LacI family DNA-binding transcriptional regulator [Devosia sp.]|nr:LacI family DNA-binding transcriptional regulator [Devosia sp.]